MRIGLKAGLSAFALLGTASGVAAQTDEIPGQAAATETPQDAEIIVTGRAQQLYRAPEATVGKVPADPLNVPQALQVITNQLIEDQGARDVTDLYRNVSGISFFSYSGVTFRGFRQDTAFYDGLRGNPFTGFSVPQLFNIERVEFLKGPAGMLYGPGSPGGTINYVTKKPSENFSARVRGIVGNYGRYGGSADVTGPITTDGSVSARAGLFFEDFDSFRSGAESRTLIADGGLAFRFTPDAKLTVQVTHYDQELPGNRLRGVQVDLDGNFLSPIEWNHNEPTDFLRLDAQVYQARFDAAITDWLTLDVSGRYFEYDEAQNYHEPQGRFDTNGDGVIDRIGREFRDQVRGTEGLSYGANLVGKFDTGPLRHTLLAGGDWSEENSLSLSRTARPRENGGPVPGLSLVDPVYGTTSGALYGLSAVPYTRSLNRATRYGVYAQDAVEIGSMLILSAGIRKDWFDDDNRLNTVDFSDSDITTRFGAIVKPREDVSLYLSWSDTFDPQSAGSQIADVGGPFAPVTGDQVEAGAKTALFGGRLQADAAIYQIKRRNILQLDNSLPPVNGRDQLRPIGEVTSRGAEFNLAADLTDDWVLTFNYGYNDTKVTGTAPGQAVTNAVGDRFVNAPEHKLGFWTRYQVEAIDTAFAFGGEYVSERVGFDRERVRPYTIFDASIITDLGFVEVMGRVQNLFDKRYAASGFGLRGGSFPGAPRTAFVELRKRF